MIHAHQLARSFRVRRDRAKVDLMAVDGVDIDVEDNEIVGFLGPNGAGKTTTLRMLTTLLKPTSGSATVAGYDLATQAVQVRRSIGYVSQSGSAASEAHAGDELVDHALLYGIDRSRAVTRAAELLEQLDLPGMWDRPPRSMSGGQRRRLDIAMGLVHDPGLIFLDEPTTGLDPQARANLWTHIGALRSDRGATIFLTTHYLDEADVLCDRILVIDHGRIVASDTPENLKRSVSGDRIELTVTDANQRADAASQLAAIDGVTEVGQHELTASGRVPSAATALPPLLRSLDNAGVVLDAVEVRRPTLDDVFLTMTGRSLREDEAA